ncbi:hypothetical protein L9F63_003459 [Diploptera punctata]|uniref:aralkylamine N-acetyltransferase n=1 Tax=Diploptera punctata TaxID=6984 RepID=A0AAD8E9L1_DIPPU|nr:hypothetical protein L9F63_003459 [Diploptera punctata]
MQFRIIKARIHDRIRVLDFLRQNFYNEEPLNAAMNNESNNLSKADEEHTLELLQEDMSLLAVNDDEDLIGICLSGLVTNKEAETMEGLADTCSCERFSKLLHFLAYVEQQSNIWTKSGVTCGLSVQALAVTQAARGYGVGRALLETTRQLAKDEGYSLFRVDCSSYFSARLAEEIGMECVFSLPFSQYKDKDGCQVFKVKSPNNHMKIYIQKLV